MKKVKMLLNIYCLQQILWKHFFLSKIKWEHWKGWCKRRIWKFWIMGYKYYLKTKILLHLTKIFWLVLLYEPFIKWVHKTKNCAFTFKYFLGLLFLQAFVSILKNTPSHVIRMYSWLGIDALEIIFTATFYDFECIYDPW